MEDLGDTTQLSLDSQYSCSFIVSRRYGSFPSVIPRIQPISSQASSPSGTAPSIKASPAPEIAGDLHRPHPPLHLLYQALQLVGGIEVTPDRFGMLQKRQQGIAFGDPLGYDLGVSRRPFGFEHLQSLVGFLFRVCPPDTSDLWPSPPAHPPSPWKGHPSPHAPHQVLELPGELLWDTVAGLFRSVLPSFRFRFFGKATMPPSRTHFPRHYLMRSVAIEGFRCENPGSVGHYDVRVVDP